jgi:PTH2 family peptidyl-tRNA hydrolase
MVSIIKRLLKREQVKQTIIVRSDLSLPKGKLASQVAHASVEGVLNSPPNIVKRWRRQGMPKIILKVKNLQQLKRYQKKANDAGLVTCLITDAGRTVVAPGTVTCLAIGPDNEKKIDAITGKLPLL